MAGRRRIGCFNCYPEPMSEDAKAKAEQELKKALKDCGRGRRHAGDRCRAALALALWEGVAVPPHVQEVILDMGRDTGNVEVKSGG